MSPDSGPSSDSDAAVFSGGAAGACGGASASTPAGQAFRAVSAPLPASCASGGFRRAGERHLDHAEIDDLLCGVFACRNGELPLGRRDLLAAWQETSVWEFFHYEVRQVQVQAIPAGRHILELKGSVLCRVSASHCGSPSLRVLPV